MEWGTQRIYLLSCSHWLFLHVNLYGNGRQSKGERLEYSSTLNTWLNQLLTNLYKFSFPTIPIGKKLLIKSVYPQHNPAFK